MQEHASLISNLLVVTHFVQSSIKIVSSKSNHILIFFSFNWENWNVPTDKISANKLEIVFVYYIRKVLCDLCEASEQLNSLKISFLFSWFRQILFLFFFIFSFAPSLGLHWNDQTQREEHSRWKYWAEIFVDNILHITTAPTK